MSIAVVTVTGNVGGDPEVRRTNGGSDVCTFSIAVNRKRGSEEFTDWYRCVCFYDKLIDVIEKYVHRGSKLTVCGDLAQQKWEDRDNVERTTVEILLNKLELNDPPPADRGRDSQRDTRNGYGHGGGRGDDRGRDRGGRDERGGGRDERGGGRDDRSRDRGGRDARGNGRDERHSTNGNGRDERNGGREAVGAAAGRGPQYDSDLNDQIPF